MDNDEALEFFTINAEIGSACVLCSFLVCDEEMDVEWFDCTDKKKENSMTTNYDSIMDL